MTCPHCESPATTKRQGPTSLGSRRFRCRSCGRRFNERSGTPLNDLQYPTDVVLLAVLRRLRDTLSCRDIAEMRLERGFSVTPETIREWECRFAPRVTERLRAKRRGRAGRSWYLDETDVQVAGRWCSLDRASDREGDLLDSRLSEQRDKHAARRFLRRLVDVAERKPQRVTTDAHPPYRRAIRGILGRKVRHRCSQDLNNRTEHSHRAVKQRSDPMLGCGRFESAARFCSAFDARRQYVRVGQRGAEWVSLVEQRRLVVQRWRSLIAEMTAAWHASGEGERLAHLVPVP